MFASVNLVCDYAPGDLAWSEIITAMADKLPADVRLIPTSVASFDTIATGFCVAQLGGRKTSRKGLIFANCAPRKDKAHARKDNEGEGLVWAELENGNEALVVASGYSLSFVKPMLKELRATSASAKGSQFRSRDNFPQVVLQCLLGDRSFLGDRIDLATIPDAPSQVVAYVDSFGNMKTSIRKGAAALQGLAPGDRVCVHVGTVRPYSTSVVRRHATVTDGSFSVPDGELAFAPGSSGYGDHFWELFKRGGSAHAEFGHPKSGERIRIEKIK